MIKKTFETFLTYQLTKLKTEENIFDCFKMDETAKLEKADISAKNVTFLQSQYLQAIFTGYVSTSFYWNTKIKLKS